MMCKDTWGTQRRGQESDRSERPETEIIKTDLSTACENESFFFYYNEILAVHSHSALLSKIILKSVMLGEKVVQTG